MDYEVLPPEPQDAEAFMSYARKRHADKQERDADIGDAVHFWDFVDARCRAAIVTQDDLDSVWLSYLMPGETSLHCEREVPHDEFKGGPSWHWPCGGQR